MTAATTPPSNASAPSNNVPTPDDWRGVATEEADDIGTGLAGFLRSRSRRLLFSLLRPYRKRLAVAAIWIILFNFSSLAGPYLVGMAIDRGVDRIIDGDGSSATLIVIVTALAFTAIVQGLSDNAFVRAVGRVGQDVLFDLRQRVFAHFQQLSMAFHEKYTSGRVISRLTSDIEAISDLLRSGFESLVWAALSLVSIGILMFTLDVPLAVVAWTIFPVVVAVTVWFRNQSSRAYRAGRESVALVIVHFVESLGGIRAVQAFRREPRNQAIFEDVNGRYRDANVWSSRLAAVYGPGVRGLGGIATAIVLLFGGLRAMDGAISVGVLVSFLLYLRRFFDPVQELSQFYNVFQAAAAALEKLSGVLEEEPSVPEPDAATTVDLTDAHGAVTFDGVTFGYGRRTDVVLAEFDLAIPGGQTVALVGATGAGKTTVARLIARFYDPTKGTVRLDGVDLRHLSTDTLRRAVVMVTQENFLFSGSIADNIAFGRPGAGRGEVEEAAQIIGAHDFIRDMPDGYDTDVAKRGGRLSAGQRQLVAFARAFLADPRVLILDEATSSLDIPSERPVQRALQTLLADRTAVIIAHRLSTVEIADRVLVIADGRIVEDGTPADLVAGSGAYHDLHQAWLDSLV